MTQELDKLKELANKKTFEQYIRFDELERTYKKYDKSHLLK